MKGVLKVICIGTLGRDPDVKSFQSGNSIATFSVAVNESWKDKKTGQQQERTEWANVVAHGKLGEICAQYLKKGSKVYVEGKLTTRKWQDKDGTDRYTTEIVANEMQMLDGKQDNGAPGGYQAPQSQQPSPAAPQRQAAPQIPDFDDDIPF